MRADRQDRRLDLGQGEPEPAGIVEIIMRGGKLLLEQGADRRLETLFDAHRGKDRRPTAGARPPCEHALQRRLLGLEPGERRCRPAGVIDSGGFVQLTSGHFALRRINRAAALLDLRFGSSEGGGCRCCRFL